MFQIEEHNGSTKYQLQSAKEIESASRHLINDIFSTNPSSAPNPIDPKENAKQSKDAHVQTSHKEKFDFVEIGTFSCGSVFGLGEQMDDRIILAKNTGAQCLLIPRYWLFQKEQNMGNVWQR